MGQATSQPDSRNVLLNPTSPTDAPRLNARRAAGSRHENREDTFSSHSVPTWRHTNLRPVTTLSRQISSTSVTAIETMATPFAAEPVSRENPMFEPHITDISALPLPQRSRRSRLSSALTSLPVRLGRTDRYGDRSLRRASVFGLFPTPSSAAQPPERPEPVPPDSIYISASAQRVPSNVRRSSIHRLLEDDATLTTDASIRSANASRNLQSSSTLHISGAGQVDRQNQQRDEGEVLEESPPRQTNYEANQGERRGIHLPLMAQANIGAGLNALESDRQHAGTTSTPSHTAPTSSSERRVSSVDARRRSRRNSAFMHHLDLRDPLRATSIGSRQSSRAQSPDENTSLSQLMNATALAIATQISQGSDGSGNNRSAVSPETLEVLFQPIHQALQNIVRNRREQVGETPARTSTNPLRVFRLGSRSSSPMRSVSSNRGRAEDDGNDLNATNGGSNSPPTESLPNITVVVVAFRSAVAEDTTYSPSRRGSLNARNSLLALPPLDESGNPGSELRNESPFRQLNSRSRFSQLRRATHRVTPGNLDWLQNRSHIQRRTSRSSTQDVTEEDFPISSRHSQQGLEDSPPGPVPPPSTPAEHTTSAVSSESASPSRRSSILSSFQNLHMNGRSVQDELPSQESSSPHIERSLRSTRQRRRSESDAARHRFLGSGSARRNGVVEPDNLDEGDERSSRNWLIYVIGTNASGDQRAWTAPGLFSDVGLLHFYDFSLG